MTLDTFRAHNGQFIEVLYQRPGYDRFVIIRDGGPAEEVTGQQLKDTKPYKGEDVGRADQSDDEEKIGQKEGRFSQSLVDAHRAATERFFDSAGTISSTLNFEAKRDGQRRITKAIQALAVEIEMCVPDGRNKSVALTALEGVQMRANRGIFAPDNQK